MTAKGAATRRRIVERAALLLRERGVVNVSLDDVREATATSKSQLFHYFPDGKSDLLLAVAVHEADQVIEDQQPMLGELTSWAAWEAWRLRVVEKYDAQGDACPLSSLTAQMGRGDPRTRTVIADLYQRWHGMLAEGVRALRDSGEIDPRTDPEQAATAVLTALAGGVAILQVTEDITYLDVALSDALAALRRRCPA
ncbi:TetR family transcriptional regulator [Streptomyces sp. PT12]|nr:TetR family transcriptional regulator [Streptomyces sp. PT12]